MMWNLPEEAEDLVDDVAATMAMEGMYITPAERKVLFKIATGELDAEDVIQDIIKNYQGE